jgi:hypothetical protein
MIFGSFPASSPALPSVRSTGRKMEKERQLADGRRRGGAESYDGEKAWTSVNHSIISGLKHTLFNASGVQYGLQTCHAIPQLLFRRSKGP